MLALIESLRGRVTVFSPAIFWPTWSGVRHHWHYSRGALLLVAGRGRTAGALRHQHGGSGTGADSLPGREAFVAELARLPWVAGVTVEDNRLRVAVLDPMRPGWGCCRWWWPITWSSTATNGSAPRWKRSS